MKRMFNQFIYLSILFSLVFFSCKKMLIPDPPIDQLTTETVFDNPASAESGVVGLYGRIVHANNGYSFLNGPITLYPSLSADEIYRTTAWQVYDEFTENAISVENANNFSNWFTAYREIYHANTLLYNLDRSASLTQSLKDRLSGEVKFLRALHYFYLVNSFGPVPLAVLPDYAINAGLLRSDTSEVYRQIIKDLKDARSQLPTTYLSAKKVRANYWPATALLARVYLYQKDWSNAELLATEMIEKGPFSLAAMDQVFKPSNPETIFQFFPAVSSTFNTIEGFLFNPAAASNIPDYDLTPQLYQAFEPNDNRIANWIKTVTINGKTFRYPYKYKLQNLAAATTKEEYSIVLRLAEQYLIRAEARTQLNKLSEGMRDLDSIRKRAGLPLLSVVSPAMNQSQLLTAVYKERQTELFCEWGHRWFDLKRTGRASQVLAPIKSKWRPTSVLYPIPQTERLNSPIIDQNPGYNQ